MCFQVVTAVATDCPANTALCMGSMYVVRHPPPNLWAAMSPFVAVSRGTLSPSIRGRQVAMSVLRHGTLQRSVR